MLPSLQKLIDNGTIAITSDVEGQIEFDVVGGPRMLRATVCESDDIAFIEEDTDNGPRDVWDGPADELADEIESLLTGDEEASEPEEGGYVINVLEHTESNSFAVTVWKDQTYPMLNGKLTTTPFCVFRQENLSFDKADKLSALLSRQYKAVPCWNKT